MPNARILIPLLAALVGLLALGLAWGQSAIQMDPVCRHADNPEYGDCDAPLYRRTIIYLHGTGFTRNGPVDVVWDKDFSGSWSEGMDQKAVGCQAWGGGELDASCNFTLGLQASDRPIPESGYSGPLDLLLFNGRAGCDGCDVALVTVQYVDSPPPAPTPTPVPPTPTVAPNTPTPTATPVPTPTPTPVLQPTPTPEQPTPPAPANLPYQLTGTVRVNDAPAPDGLIVNATLGGQAVAGVRTSGGQYRLTVPDAYAGESIGLVVDGKPTGQTVALSGPAGSFYLVDLALTTAEDLVTALAGIAGQWDRVFYYNRETGLWDFHHAGPEWAIFNTLNTLETGEFYWIHALVDTVLTHDGQTIELFTGWNLVAW